jgi:hypothetical protein
MDKFSQFGQLMFDVVFYVSVITALMAFLAGPGILLGILVHPTTIIGHIVVAVSSIAWALLVLLSISAYTEGRAEGTRE